MELRIAASLDPTNTISPANPGAIPSPCVMSSVNPLGYDLSHLLGKSHCPDESFAMGIRLRCPDGRAQDPQPEGLPQFLVEF
jgi:hypothetical protein